MQVRDLMRPTLITCPPDTTLGQAAVLLAQHRVHSLIVADATGAPLGVLSDMDMLAGEWLSADADSLSAMRTMTAGQMMSAPPVTIEAGASAAEAAERMRRERVHRLLVVDGDKPVGVISVSDLVAYLGRASAERRSVADVMSRGLVVCLDGTPLADVARAMTERRSRSVIVVDGGGRPLGVVTGLDLLALCRDDCGDKTVSDVMHPPMVVEPAASLQAAAEMMIKHHVHRLLVADPKRPEGMPLGIVSTSDIVAEMAGPGSVWQSAAEHETPRRDG